MAELKVSLQVVRGVAVVRVAGALDYAAMGEFEDALARGLARKHKDMVLNMAEVDFVSSTGWGAVGAAAKKIRTAGGRFVLCGLVPAVYQSYEMVGAGRVIPAHSDEAAALDSLGAPVDPPGQKSRKK